MRTERPPGRASGAVGRVRSRRISAKSSLGGFARAVGVEPETRTLLGELQGGRYGKALARPLAIVDYLLT